MLELKNFRLDRPEWKIGGKNVSASISASFPRQDDLQVLHAGMEQCPPAHAFGPAVRDYYLIHFVLRGQGRFQVENRTFQLRAGQGFLICPDQVTFYEADQQDPWLYVWIAFTGKSADDYLRQAGLSRQAPILENARSHLHDAHSAATDDMRRESTREPAVLADCFRQIADALDLRQGREMRLTALLLLLLSHLIEQNPNPPVAEDQINRRDWYVRQAQDYLEVNYARKLSIAGLARHLGLDRSYFGQLFREVTGFSPRSYLLQLRMTKACSLMTHTRLPVAAVARSVGYEDPLLFSRMFHRIMTCSPSEYCRQQSCSQDSDTSLPK